MIAAIPLMFGFQQVAEGLVWQAMGAEAASGLRELGVLLFLVFAYVVWPAWLPWSLSLFEVNSRRKRILNALGVLGIGVSLVAVWILYQVEVQAYVVGHSLNYAFLNLTRRWPENLEALLYFTPTVIPFFVSSLRTIKIARALVFVSMLLAKIINAEAASSVWCFFAAPISFFIAVNVLWWQKGRLS